MNDYEFANLKEKLSEAEGSLSSFEEDAKKELTSYFKSKSKDPINVIVSIEDGESFRVEINFLNNKGQEDFGSRFEIYYNYKHDNQVGMNIGCSSYYSMKDSPLRVKQVIYSANLWNDIETLTDLFENHYNWIHEEYTRWWKYHVEVENENAIRLNEEFEETKEKVREEIETPGYTLEETTNNCNRHKYILTIKKICPVVYECSVIKLTNSLSVTNQFTAVETKNMRLNKDGVIEALARGWSLLGNLYHEF